jgi:LuxR family maltose regulon positive regulatory protein
MARRGDLIAEGNAALQSGAWRDARAAFEAANADEASGEAHEGLSWAAWWLNDGDLTISSREAAFRLYRSGGDGRGAARMAMWLGTDYEDFRGELPIAAGWRQVARRLLEDVAECEEHGWLAVFEADVALVFHEDVAKARSFAADALAIGRRRHLPDVETMALAVDGLALVAGGAVTDGMSCLDQAAAAALGGVFSDPALANRVLCYLIFGCERVRDFQRAAQWCERMREIADQMQLTFAQGFCRAHYAAVLISRGKWEEAESELADATRMLEASRLPYVAESTVRLGELRRRQGRNEEAEKLFHTAEWHPIALIGLGELSLDAARPMDALDYANRFLRQIPDSSRLQRAAALELLVRAEALLGNHKQARAALAALDDISEAAATPLLQAARSFSGGMLAIAAYDLEGALAQFEDAADYFGRSGTPYEAARARLELASTLATLGRPERARSEARAALKALDALGASFHASRAAALIRSIQEPEPAQSAGTRSELTARQVEILRHISKGDSDRHIAANLGVSEHTVHRHVANILIRLDVPTRAAAAAWAGARGLL